jgi:hypothetical protein
VIDARIIAEIHIRNGGARTRLWRDHEMLCIIDRDGDVCRNLVRLGAVEKHHKRDAGFEVNFVVAMSGG